MQTANKSEFHFDKNALLQKACFLFRHFFKQKYVRLGRSMSDSVASAFGRFYLKYQIMVLAKPSFL